MEVSTVSKQVVSGVVVRLSIEEARELIALLSPLPGNGIAYPLYKNVGRALDKAADGANEQ